VYSIQQKPVVKCGLVIFLLKCCIKTHLTYLFHCCSWRSQWDQCPQKNLSCQVEGFYLRWHWVQPWRLQPLI